MRVLGSILKVTLFGLFIYAAVSYWPVITARGDGEFDVTPIPSPKLTSSSHKNEVEGSFWEIVRKGPPLSAEPINRDASIIIEKIGVNSPIKLDVSVTNPTEYNAALNEGVAHARGSGKPSDTPSNTYLFAHSTANEANIARYAAVFTKLYQLRVGDPMTVFYKGTRYDYQVVEQKVIPSFEVSVLTREFDYPALTLQTCDPPGVPKDRRVVTAKLVGVYEE